MKKLIQSALAQASDTVDARGSADVLVKRLAAVRQVQKTLEQVEREYAERARERGATWAQIGDAYEVTPEAAMYRFGGGKERRQTRSTAPAEPLVGESLADVAAREGINPATLRRRIQSGVLPQYKLVPTTYRGRPATRVVPA